MTNQQKQERDWEKEFDELFQTQWVWSTARPMRESLKSFIRTLIAERERKVRRDGNRTWIRELEMRGITITHALKRILLSENSDNQEER